MNDQERAELARLKSRQAWLEQELRELSTRLKLFEERFTTAGRDQLTAPGTGQPAPTPLATQAPTQSIPPIIRLPVTTATAPPPPGSKPIRPEEKAPAAPAVPVTGATRVEARAAGLEFPAFSSTTAGSSAPVQTGATSKAIPEAGTKPAESRSFEMRLGTYWLVRVGIVMVLTGLVFFGNLAYHNYISRLGPGGKLSLLYVASAMLLGAGSWWQRNAAKDNLRNYAQVLFAGGWAALYFTTYAAHHVGPLRVIQSALLDGVLLLGCAGWMVWVADRKKSEVMALFAVGLAYYTSVITRVGYFTLFSNLLLAGAAVCFLVRNRWAVLSFGSLLATYAAYGFWRFFDGRAWHWASPAEGLWSGTYFLIAYWIIFSSGVFLSRDKKFAGENRATFLTLNNGAFFTLFLLTMLQVKEGGFWKFALVYGCVLLGMAEVARRVLSTEPASANSYLTQGLLLVTVGFISEFAGLQLALILAAESVVLLLMSYRRENAILRTTAYLAAGLALGWSMDGMRQNDSPGLWLAMGLGSLMLVNAIVVHRRTVAETRLLMRPQPAYFAILALAVWLVATWNNTARENFPIVIACEAVLLTFSIYLLGIRELTLLGQGFLVLGQAGWTGNWISFGQSPPWWNPALMIAISLGLSHWWQKQKVLQTPPQLRSSWQIVYALAIVGLLYCWLNPQVQAPGWLVLSGGLGLAVTAYGVLTRAWYLAAGGQILVAICVAQFFLQLAHNRPGWGSALAPLAVLGFLSWATTDWFQRRPEADGRISQPLLQIALIYRWIALVMSIAWVCEYIPERERTWVLMLLGLAVFVWAGLKRSREGLLFSGVFSVTALVLFWLPLLENPTVYWPDLVAILVLLGQRQVARRFSERYTQRPEFHAGIIVAGGLSLWLFVSRWVLEQASGFYLTASWSLLALGLFTCGIVLRERVYRWLGLGILACAMGRVIIFDVWKLETLYQILSFMALGIVLLVLGFIYNKYQEKIKEWL